MANPTVTYTFANATTADATQVNTNFSDILTAMTDGLKDFTVGTVTASGQANLGGAFVLSGTSTVVATNGGSSTVANTTSTVILAPSGTIASYSLTLPASPYEGQIVSIVSGGNTITSLTLAANGGHTIATGAGASALVSGESIELIFRATIWYRRGRSVAKAPTVQNLLSSTGTYTTPSGCLYIRVRMVGGGGGGAGAGSGVGGGSGGDGGDTTFGTTLLSANGGKGGATNGAIGGVGGSASLGSGPIGIALNGGTGGGAGVTAVSSNPDGGMGGSSAFGGSGGASGGTGAAGGGNAPANTGGGGGGGAKPGTNIFAGGGGGAGGFVDAIISSPSATYSYAVGAAGSAGSAGTSGAVGGTGGSGMISVEEYY